MNLFSKIIDWYFKKESLPYWCIFLIDCTICFLSGIFVFALFFKIPKTVANIAPISTTLLFYLFFNILGFRWFHTYSGVIRYSSFVDLKRVAYAMTGSFLAVTLIHYPIIFHPPIHSWILPLNLRHIVSIYIVSTILLWTFRIVIKGIYDTAFDNEKAKRALIYGVKEGGVGLAKNIASQKPQQFRLFGFIAHEDGFANRYLMGKKVYPFSEELRDVIRENRINAVLVSPLRNDAFRDNSALQDLLINAGVRIYMTEGVQEWDNTSSNQLVNTLKEISIEDLLPRDQIQIDMESVGHLLAGKKILITGSAGSIGSEMVRQICLFSPAELMLVDQAETPQHDIRLMMAHEHPHIKTSTVIASIANKDRMERIFADFRPDYVFHAAAYKHVPMMENNPSESIQNNVWGTKVVADLSWAYGVKKFVMVSTDKAVNPTNVMGCSKRICEIYVQSLDKAEKEGKVPGSTQFVTTRFGNVLGSNGSVIPLFERQIKAGGPVTVTHPDIIRFFMLIPEACKLVLEAGTKGHGGEIFVFDMGKPVRIADLAKRMILLSGAKNVQIEYTGLRAGEKLYEEVLNDEEGTLPSFNPKVRIAKVREYDYEQVNRDIEELVSISHTYNEMAIVKKMKEMVPEFKSKNSIYAELDA
jgi:capsular polysaccharide biosynthesis protein cap5D